MAEMNDTILSVKNYKLYSKENGLTLMLDIPDLQVKAGSAVFLTGDNGAGKSSFIKSLFSPYREDEYYEIDGASDVKLFSRSGCTLDLNGAAKIGYREYEQSIVYIGQEENFGTFDGIIASLRLPAAVALRHLYGGKEDYADKTAMLDRLVKTYALRFFEDVYRYEKKFKAAKAKGGNSAEEAAFHILKKKKSRDCSGGQKKLISILSGLIRLQVLGCDVLVMDEPLNHLDHKNKRAVSDLISEIKEQRADHPLTLIIISHCMVFDFIGEPTSFEYEIVNKTLRQRENKIYFNCLHCYEEGGFERENK